MYKMNTTLLLIKIIYIFYQSEYLPIIHGNQILTDKVLSVH